MSTRYFENERTDFVANGHKWSTEQGYELEVIEFGGQGGPKSRSHEDEIRFRSLAEALFGRVSLLVQL